MKSFFTFFLQLVCVVSFAQIAVTVDLAKAELQSSDTLLFTVGTGAQVDLEVAVFSENEMVLHERPKLNGPNHQYRILAARMKPGKYYVLVTGDAIHEQRSFIVK
jgi:hypothetical protein